MASWWNCFIICSQAPVKLKLKMREDLSDKEITDISVSSTSFSKEFSVYEKQLPVLHVVHVHLRVSI